MADAEGQEKKKRVFKKFSFRGVDLEDLVKMDRTEFIAMLNARHRRTFAREVPNSHIRFYKKCVEAKKDVPVGEKPNPVKTHLRGAIVLPELVGSIVNIYNGKTFTSVEIRPDMIGHYLAELSVTYKLVKHGKAGIGATKSSRFTPLK